MLQTLKSLKKTIILATAKPEKYAVKILKHFGLFDYFDFVAGATMDETRNKKEDVIAYIIEEYGIEDIKRAVMIGDREHDVLGAKKFGIDSVGVLYGYGDLEELTKAGATYIAKTVEHIMNFV